MSVPHSLALFCTLLMMRCAAEVRNVRSFIFERVAQMISYASALTILYVLLHRFGHIEAWTWPDVAFLFAFHLLTYSIGASFTFLQMRSFEDLVRYGELDALLVKPVNVWVFLAGSRMELGYVGHIVLSVGVMVWAISMSAVDWDAPRVAYLVLSVVSGALCIGALVTVIGASAVIFGSSRYFFSVFGPLWEASRYPLSVLPFGVQLMFVTIVPLAFSSTIPVAFLLGKTIELVPMALAGPVALGVGPTMAWLASRYWLFCMRKYQGGGG